jgi:hypothetical protein
MHTGARVAATEPALVHHANVVLLAVGVDRRDRGVGALLVPARRGRHKRDAAGTAAHLTAAARTTTAAAVVGVALAVTVGPAAAVVVVVVVSLAGRPQDAGEEVHQNQTGRRQAGADDADVDFNGRPADNLVVVPGGVRRVGEAEERVQAENTDNSNAGTRLGG